ncbi:MAG: hypothetical protein ACI9C4_000115 [Paraglaciecola sp.]|jgi:hypothetical protein
MPNSQCEIREEHMKFILGLLFSLTLLTAVADEGDVADVALIIELNQYCAEVAAEDGTGIKSQEQFMLDCVNKELADAGYQTLEKL